MIREKSKRKFEDIVRDALAYLREIQQCSKDTWKSLHQNYLHIKFPSLNSIICMYWACTCMIFLPSEKRQMTI